MNKFTILLNDELFSSIEIDDIGDSKIQTLYDKYAAFRLAQKIPIFDDAHKHLTENKHFSKRTSFGEMRIDCYIWAVKTGSEKTQVIRLDTQSNHYIFIKKHGRFDIRELEKPSQIKPFTDSNFKRSSDNPLYNYGDRRDKGYMGSGKYLDYPESMTVDYADAKLFYILNRMDTWGYYLENPDHVE